MIDIMHPSEVAGTESRRSSGVLWVFLTFVLLGALGWGGTIWFNAHNKPAVVVDPEASMTAVKAADSAWAKAASARDVETVLSYYADGAFVLAPNQDLATNKSSIRKVWTDLLVKGTDVSWTPGAADVSSSGDLVYLEGYYLNTIHPAKGKTSLDRGKYLSVWKKQSDGSWKCVADTWNSDLPAKK